MEHSDKERRIRQIGAYAEGIVYTVFSIENQPKQSLDSFIKERYAKVETREVTVSGVTGREAVGHTGDWVAQYFAAAGQLYAFRTFGAPPEDPRVKQFFSSLVLAKNPEGIPLFDGIGVPFQPAAQTEPQDANKPTAYVGRDVDRKVRLAMKPEPMYTEAARQNSVTGTVVLKVIFSSNGDVNNIRIVSGLPFGLTEKAIDAAKKIKFIPAVKDGRFVSMWMQLEYNFNLY
ncbi:MAG TPA: energy transducer TonB [Pyrinomonadaceae bacterium]|nr:energy transducer TonB [Pyrinomonadaceae bacterium]